MLAASLATIALHGHHHLAFAKSHDSDGDDESSDEDDGKGDKGDADSGEESDDDPDDAKNQPLVTAGGLFTIDTYPLRETARPLTMTGGITQLRASLGTDISAKGAFATGGLSLDVVHGVTDNFTILGGFDNAYNLKQFSVYGGFEGSLVYDLLDIRVAANLHRNAIAQYSNFCSPLATGDGPNPSNPATDCRNPTAAIVNLPNGDYTAGGIKFSVDVGFPIRYAFTPQIALIALQTLISIDFNSVKQDHTTTSVVGVLDGMGNPVLGSDGVTPLTNTINIPAPNGAKPDLNPSIGFLTNPIPQLSVVVQAQLRIPDFDTSAGAFQVPVSAAVEFAPSSRFDIGLQFILLNVKPPDGQSPIDNRFISAYVQARL